MKLMISVLGLMIFTSLAQAQGLPTSTTRPSAGGTQTSATSVKDAKEACKKDGKEGKDLVLCIKEKVK